MSDTEADAETGEASEFWKEAADALEGKTSPSKPKPEPVKAKEPKEEAPEPIAEGEEEILEEKEADEGGDEATPEQDGEEPEDDPWKGIPEHLRTEFEALQEKNKDLEHRNRSNSGRLGALQKKIDELSRKLEAREASPAKDEKTAATEDPVAAVFDRVPKWKKFEEDFGSEVAEPIKDAMRLFFEDLHSRIKDTESQARSLKNDADAQRKVAEGQKLETMYREWSGDESEAGEQPAWLQYVSDNYSDIEAFAQSSKVMKAIWDANTEYVDSAQDVLSLLAAFEAQRSRKAKKDEAAPKAVKPNGAPPKPEPRELTPKQKAQLKSAASPAPRSAPGPGRRSDDLPDPDEYAFEYFATKAEAQAR